jgi:transposase, IS30 family
MTYRHLTLELRYQIAALRIAGMTQKAIAERIGCHPSTIGRELSRNGDGDSYVGSTAHGRARKRRSAASARSPLDPDVITTLAARLKEEHSPEQIKGRLALLKAGTVSHTTVYRYARKLRLRLHLRHPKRRRRYGKPRPVRFADRKPIQQRPAEVATRSRIGDWEADTVRPARGTGVVITLVERRSGYVRLAWSPDGTADAVAQAIECRLDRLAHYVHTITCDRGSEFAEDRRLEKALKTAIYFADPHSPWQRGCNENFNGLLRQYFPRSRDFSTISMEELQAAEDRLNDRPRKRLGYLTPSEVFFNPNHVALQG